MLQYYGGGAVDQNQASFYPFAPREISVLTELALGHLRYRLTDVPPQPNSPPDTVFDSDTVTVLQCCGGGAVGL